MVGVFIDSLNVTVRDVFAAIDVAESAGEKQAEGLNNGIIFLMIVPYLVMGVIALVVKKQSK